MTAQRLTARSVHLPVTASWGIRLAVVTAVISGFAVWLNAFAVKQVPDPAVYTTLKNLVAAVILLAGASAMGGMAEARSLDRRRWGILLAVGIIGGSIPFLLFFTGLAEATAPGAAFIQKTLFIWVALLAVPLLGERLGGLQVGALGVLIVGQLLLVPPKLDGAGWGSGETMIAAATLMWAVEVIIVKRVLVSVSPGVVAAARMGFGTILLLGYLALTGGLSGIAALSLGAWGWVLLTGIVLAAYVGTWFAALRRAPASAVASVLVVGAVVTAGLQTISNGTVPAPGALLGIAAMIVAAVIIGRGALRTQRSVMA